MSAFDGERKATPHYLEAINDHVTEKSAGVYSAMREAAALHGEVRLLEIGPGGGVMLDGIADRLESDPLEAPVHVTSIDLHDPTTCSKSFNAAIDKLQRAGVETHFVQGDATNLPFREGSYNVVNASAVGHEIFSYAGGYEGIDDMFAGASRSLVPGGLFVYRDVFPVEGSIYDQHEMLFVRPAWQEFSKVFLPYYLEHANHPYDRHESNVRIDDDQMGMLIETPKGLARDLQRHYLMFRDYVWRSGILGFRPNKSHDNETEWLPGNRLGEGNVDKKVYYEVLLSPAAFEYPALYDGLGGHEVFMGGRMFDAITDIEMDRHFKGERHTGGGWRYAVDDWLSREGPEVYIYSDIESMRNLSILQSPTDLKEVRYQYYDRRYYDGYLKDGLYTGALSDGKMEITFQKQPESVEIYA